MKITVVVGILVFIIGFSKEVLAQSDFVIICVDAEVGRISKSEKDVSLNLELHNSCPASISSVLTSRRSGSRSEKIVLAPGEVDKTGLTSFNSRKQLYEGIEDIWFNLSYDEAAYRNDVSRLSTRLLAVLAAAAFSESVKDDIRDFFDFEGIHYSCDLNNECTYVGRTNFQPLGPLANIIQDILVRNEFEKLLAEREAIIDFSNRFAGKKIVPIRASRRSKSLKQIAPSIGRVNIDITFDGVIAGEIDLEEFQEEVTEEEGGFGTVLNTGEKERVPLRFTLAVRFLDYIRTASSFYAFAEYIEPFKLGYSGLVDAPEYIQSARLRNEFLQAGVGFVAGHRWNWHLRAGAARYNASMTTEQSNENGNLVINKLDVESKVVPRFDLGVAYVWPGTRFAFLSNLFFTPVNMKYSSEVPEELRLPLPSNFIGITFGVRFGILNPLY